MEIHIHPPPCPGVPPYGGYTPILRLYPHMGVYPHMEVYSTVPPYGCVQCPDVGVCPNYGGIPICGGIPHIHGMHSHILGYPCIRQCSQHGMQHCLACSIAFHAACLAHVLFATCVNLRIGRPRRTKSRSGLHFWSVAILGSSHGCSAAWTSAAATRSSWDGILLPGAGTPCRLSQAQTTKPVSRCSLFTAAGPVSRLIFDDGTAPHRVGIRARDRQARPRPPHRRPGHDDRLHPAPELQRHCGHYHGAHGRWAMVRQLGRRECGLPAQVGQGPLYAPHAAGPALIAGVNFPVLPDQP